MKLRRIDLQKSIYSYIFANFQKFLRKCYPIVIRRYIKNKKKKQQIQQKRQFEQERLQQFQMKQELKQNHSFGFRKHHPHDSNQQFQVSLLDIQSDCTSDNNTYGNILRKQYSYLKQPSSTHAIKQSRFQQSIAIQNLTHFLESEMNQSCQPKTKRPRTLIHNQNFSYGYMSNDTKDNIMMVLQSSPNNTLKGENQDAAEINIRTFQSKFIRELNFRDNERLWLNRKRHQLNKHNETNVSHFEQKHKKAPKPHIRKQLQQIWHNGTRVLSQFKNDIIHGQTQIFYPNGARFNGRYDHGVRIFGEFDFNNGYSYCGGFWGDKFQGQGQLTLPNGKVFSGEWIDNQLLGKVEIKYPSGDLYYGEIMDFKKHGRGYLFFKNGQKFIGEFENGNITGKGEYFIDEQCVGRGIWKNGELVQKVQDDEQFDFFDTISYFKKSFYQQKTQKIQKNSQYINDLDFVELDGVQDEESHVSVRNVVVLNKKQNRSQKAKLLRKSSQGTKMGQSQRGLQSQISNDDYIYSADITQMCRQLKGINPNHFTSQNSQSTQHNTKSSANNNNYSSQHSHQSQQQWLYKTGKFVSVGTISKTNSCNGNQLASNGGIN